MGRDNEDARGRKPDAEKMVDRRWQMGRLKEGGSEWMEADLGGRRPESLWGSKKWWEGGQTSK